MASRVGRASCDLVSTILHLNKLEAPTNKTDRHTWQARSSRPCLPALKRKQDAADASCGTVTRPAGSGGTPGTQLEGTLGANRKTLRGSNSSYRPCTGLMALS